MPWLITSDLHLTDRPRDSYRFGIFPWIARMQRLYDTTATFILGDLTDQKDKHSSALVNRLVDEITGLQPPVYILKGNHDFIDPANPFFKFLSCVEGLHFVTDPTWLEEHKVALIPHQPDQATFDAACGIIQPDAKAVMCHQTFDGAISEASGARLAGLGASLIGQKGARVLAGDIHKPQYCGVVSYVGSPYHVRFGDDYTPRVLLIKDGKEQNLYFDAPRKWSLMVRDEDDILHNENLRSGDQAKITIEMTREEVVEHGAHKKRVLDACKEVGLEVYGCELRVSSSKPRERMKVGVVKSSKEVLEAFCASEKVASDIKSAGEELLNEHK